MIKQDARTIIYSIVVLVMVVTAVAANPLSEALAYHRDTFSIETAWSLLTCHFVHLSLNHALLNMLGTIILLLVFKGELSGLETGLLLSVCIPVTGLAIHLFSASIGHYYGFSGVLHGLLVGELIITLRRFFWLHLMVIAAVIGKVLWEWLGFGHLISSAEFIGGEVAVDAHLYGVLAAVPIALLLLALRLRNQSQAE